MLTTANFSRDLSLRRLSIYDRGVVLTILLAVRSHSLSLLSTDTVRLRVVRIRTVASVGDSGCRPP